MGPIENYTRIILTKTLSFEEFKNICNILFELIKIKDKFNQNSLLSFIRIVIGADVTIDSSNEYEYYNLISLIKNVEIFDKKVSELVSNCKDSLVVDYSKGLAI